MRDETVAKNYAETLLEVADRNEGLEIFGDGIEMVARFLDENQNFRMFLETPRISVSQKKEVIQSVFSDKLPVMLINFLVVVLDKRRQRILGDIAREYQILLDQRLNRMRIEVTVARSMDASYQTELQDKLTTLIGCQAISDIRVDPMILGGIIVRAGDMIYDGSLRRKLDGMRRKLLMTDLHPVGDS